MASEDQSSLHSGTKHQAWRRPIYVVPLPAFAPTRTGFYRPLGRNTYHREGFTRLMEERLRQQRDVDALRDGDRPSVEICDDYVQLGKVTKASHVHSLRRAQLTQSFPISRTQNFFLERGRRRTQEPRTRSLWCSQRAKLALMG